MDSTETLIFLNGALMTVTVAGILILAAIVIEKYGVASLLVGTVCFLYVRALKVCIASLERAHGLYVLRPE